VSKETDLVPDSIVLKDMDEGDVMLMRFRMMQARQNLDQVDITLSEQWNWVGPDHDRSSLDRVGRSTSLLVYGTENNQGFALADETMRYPFRLESSDATLGVPVAKQLIDRLEAYLQVPTCRLDQLEAAFRGFRGSTCRNSTLVQDYATALHVIVSRCVALCNVFGKEGMLSYDVGVIPPSPGQPGNMVDPRLSRRILSPCGAKAVFRGLPKLLTMSSSERHGFLASRPKVLTYIRVPALDAMETMRFLGDKIMRKANKVYLVKSYQR